MNSTNPQKRYFYIYIPIHTNIYVCRCIYVCVCIFISSWVFLSMVSHVSRIAEGYYGTVLYLSLTAVFRFPWFKPAFLLLPQLGFPALFMNAHLAPTLVDSSVWEVCHVVVISLHSPLILRLMGADILESFSFQESSSGILPLCSAPKPLHLEPQLPFQLRY